MTDIPVLWINMDHSGLASDFYKHSIKTEHLVLSNFIWDFKNSFIPLRENFMFHIKKNDDNDFSLEH